MLFAINPSVRRTRYMCCYARTNMYSIATALDIGLKLRIIVLFVDRTFL